MKNKRKVEKVFQLKVILWSGFERGLNIFLTQLLHNGLYCLSELKWFQKVSISTVETTVLFIKYFTQWNLSYHIIINCN